MKFKRILSICLICLFVFSLINLNSKKVFATTSDNGKGTWTPEETETTNVLGMEHLSVYGTANDTKPQHINVLSMKTDGYSSKLVTWSVTSGNNKYTRQTLDVIAKDYEEKHPGWIVVGGINADQYTTGYGSDIGAGSAYFTPQTYYPLIMDGESRIPYTVLNSYANHVGFANNGAIDSLVSASPIVGYELKIIDENGNLIKSYMVDKINESPNANETTVWSTYISISVSNTYVNREVKSSNNIYVITKPELAYMNNCVEYGGVNSMFGRGTIGKITNDVILVSNQFAIETSNSEISEALAIGTRVVVNAKYESDALNNVEASTGYHSVHRYNDVDQPLVHTSYDGSRYSRAIIGKKADGTYVLLTVDLATNPNDLSVRYVGMGFDECNATLKHYGVVEAYQMDGGGSVTSIIRNEDGEFDITNYPRDGVRANMTGLLFVVRDPELEVTSDYHSITLQQKVVENMPSTVPSIIATVNGKEYKLEDGKTTITGLEENTKYNVEIKYDVVSNDDSMDVTTYTLNINVYTSMFEGITPKFEVQNVSKNSFEIINNNHNEVQNVVVDVDNFKYSMNDATLKIADLIGDTTYDIYISYDIYDEISGRTYSRTYQPLSVTTLNYSIPEITEFVIYRTTDNRITYKYKYVDSDNIVTNAYILFNEEQYELTTASGLKNFEDLDLTSNIYDAKIVLEYVVDDVNKKVESQILSAGTTALPVITYTITYNLKGGTIKNAPQSYDDVITLNDIPEPTKDDNEFTGWLVNGESVDDYNKELSGNLELVAQWNEIQKPTPEPEEPTQSGGCNMGVSIKHFISLTTLIGLATLLLRKKR